MEKQLQATDLSVSDTIVQKRKSALNSLIQGDRENDNSEHTHQGLDMLPAMNLLAKEFEHSQKDVLRPSVQESH